MAISAFTVGSIKPSLYIGSHQRFIYGEKDVTPEPLGDFYYDSEFTPIVGMPSIGIFGHRNNTFSGYRWIHTTNSTDTIGELKLQSFVNGQSTGTDILTIGNSGGINFNGPVSVNNSILATQDYVNSAVDSSFGPNVALPFAGLNYNWENPADLSDPGTTVPYVHTNLLTDNAPFFKALHYEVKTNDVARGWKVKYNLGDPNTLSPSIQYEFNHPLLGATLFPLTISYAGTTGTISSNCILSMGNKKITTLANGTASTDGVNKGQMDVAIATFFTSVPLNSITPPNGAVNFNSQKLTSVATGTAATDGVNKGQMDTAITNTRISSLLSPNGDVDWNNQSLINVDGLATDYCNANSIAADTIRAYDTIYGRRPSGLIYMEGNTTSVTTSAGVFVKIPGTTTSVLLNQFTMPNPNQLQYTGTIPIVADLTAYVMLRETSATTLIPGLRLYKNGVQVLGTRFYKAMPADYEPMAIGSFVAMSTNDYIEVYFSSNVGGLTFWAEHLTLKITTT